MSRRKELAIVAMNKLSNVWIRKDKIKQTLKVKLYKSFSSQFVSTTLALKD